MRWDTNVVWTHAPANNTWWGHSCGLFQHGCFCIELSKSGTIQWRHLSYLSSYSGWLKAKSEYSLDCYVMHSPYLRHLRKIANGSHQASAMKQNLYCLMRSACPYTTLSTIYGAGKNALCYPRAYYSLWAHDYSAVQCMITDFWLALVI